MGRIPVGPPSRHTGKMRLMKSAWHLTARFFTSLSSTPPSAANQEWAESRLSQTELALWNQQSNQDRRHSAIVARRFAEMRTNVTQAEIAGALLHDVGKVECGLGTFGRVAGTLVGPHGQRFKSYHAHEEIGAELAERAGSDTVTVALIAGDGPAYDDLCMCDHA